jgi:hypothetical protein
VIAEPKERKPDDGGRRTRGNSQPCQAPFMGKTAARGFSIFDLRFSIVVGQMFFFPGFLAS